MVRTPEQGLDSLSFLVAHQRKRLIILTVAPPWASHPSQGGQEMQPERLHCVRGGVPGPVHSSC